jgi:hypothetical protein
MCKERVVFFVAGALVGLGTLLAWLISPWWLLLSGFVGFNMLQSSLTGFCPLTKILNALKVEQCSAVSPLQ